MGSGAVGCHACMSAADVWIAVFRRTLPELYAFVSRRVGGDRDAAEDVTQETWLRAVQAWQRDGLPKEPIAWLKTVARRLIANAARDSHATAISPEVDVEDLVGSGAVQGGSELDVATLYVALDRIGVREAALIEAFHIDGKSVRDLAAEHQTSERAIEGRLRRARKKLRRAFEGKNS